MKRWSVYLIGAALCVGLGYSLAPEKVRTEVRTVEITKNVEGLRENIIEIKRPGGVVETRTERTVERISESERTKTTLQESISRPQWSVGAYGTVFDSTPEYTLTVDRRILGNLFLGISAQSDLKSLPQIGIGLRLEF